jgi:hypothetical protein
LRDSEALQRLDAELRLPLQRLRTEPLPHGHAFGERLLGRIEAADFRMNASVYLYHIPDVTGRLSLPTRFSAPKFCPLYERLRVLVANPAKGT